MIQQSHSWVFIGRKRKHWLTVLILGIYHLLQERKYVWVYQTIWSPEECMLTPTGWDHLAGSFCQLLARDLFRIQFQGCTLNTSRSWGADLRDHWDSPGGDLWVTIRARGTWVVHDTIWWPKVLWPCDKITWITFTGKTGSWEVNHEISETSDLSREALLLQSQCAPARTPEGGGPRQQLA